MPQFLHQNDHLGGMLRSPFWIHRRGLRFGKPSGRAGSGRLFYEQPEMNKIGDMIRTTNVYMLYVGIVCATGMLANRKQVLDSITSRNSG